MMNLVFVSNILEYCFLILHVYLITKMALESRKRKKVDENFKIRIEERNSVLVYKTPVQLTSKTEDIALNDDSKEVLVGPVNRNSTDKSE